MDTTTRRITRLQIGIIALTVATAAIHFILAFIVPDWQIPFILNGLGYLALLAAYFLPQFAPYHNSVRWMLIAFAGVTLIGYFVINGIKMDPLGWLTKAIEIALIVLLWMDGRK